MAVPDYLTDKKRGDFHVKASLCHQAATDSLDPLQQQPVQFAGLHDITIERDEEKVELIEPLKAAQPDFLKQERRHA